MQLGAALVRGGEQLAAGTPAEAAHRVLLDAHRALRLPARRRERPRLVRATALIGDDGEPMAIGRERERGAAREAARGVRHARESLARYEIGERTGHRHEASGAPAAGGPLPAP